MATLVKWSVEDYHQMITAGILGDRSGELIAGNIVEMSPVRKGANYLRSLLNGLA